MTRDSRRLFVILLLAILASGIAKRGLARSSKFVPPDILGATDIPYPIDTMATGIVTLTVNLNVTGIVQNVQVLRDVPPLTDAAVVAVKSWVYKPGTLDGNPVASSLNVSVVFNPGNLQGQKLILPPVNLTAPTIPTGYLPPEIAAASYASYPVDSVATGAVVLDLIIDKSNDIKKITPVQIQPEPLLTSQAISATQNWTINSATFQGKPIKSNIIIAFVFRSPTITSP